MKVFFKKTRRNTCWNISRSVLTTSMPMMKSAQVLKRATFRLMPLGGADDDDDINAREGVEERGLQRSVLAGT
jgi:hypothetical protein